jgi:hypothetical protein
MLEVVNGQSPKHTLESSGIVSGDCVKSLGLLLNAGDISKLNECGVRKIDGCIELDSKILIDDFLLNLNKHDDVRVWYSGIDSEEMAFFYYVMYLINRNGINSNVYAINVGLKNLHSLACFKDDEVKNILVLSKKIEKEKIKEYSAAWEKLTKENGDLRLIDEGRLKTYSYDYLDKNILEKLKKYKEIGKSRFIVVDCMSSELCSIFGSAIF